MFFLITNMDFKTIQSDLNPKEAKDLIDLLGHYAQDIMGGGEELSEYVKTNLAEKLKKRTDAVIVIAYLGEQAIGLAICFEGFSTFSAKPLLNIHDFVVKSEFRGQGVAKLLLEKIMAIAKERDCCKITLEVLQGNQRAIKIYRDFGFDNYQLDAQMGHALFLQKTI